MALILFLKAGIPPGARWITVHPNGPAEKGQPILIQPQPDGSAKVIGGAGGSLNHMRIRAVRSEADYKADAEKQRQAKAEEKKKQRAVDKAAGILESKKKANDAVREQERTAQREFVETVAKVAGWNPADLAPPEVEGLSEPAAKKVLQQHHQQVFQRAREVVDEQRQRLVNDAEARQQAGLGEVPLTAPTPADLSVEDLAPVQTGESGLGFAPEYGKRAAAAGLTPDTLAAEKAEIKPLTDDQRKARIERGETAKAVRKELEALRPPEPKKIEADQIDAAKAADLLRAEKKLRALQQQARKAKKQIDDSKTEPKAFVLEHSEDPDIDAKIRQDLDDELRTVATNSFLAEVGRLADGDPRDRLGKHIGVGAFNAINAVALTVGGDALVDRSVVDVLGIAGAAQILARRVRTDLPDQIDQIADGMREFHTDTHAAATATALTKAAALMDAAKAIELPDGEHATDLQNAQELNAKRRAAVGDAQRMLGQVYGEMEANAALVAALGRPASDRLDVPMGKSSIDVAITQARAIGLQRGDYVIEQRAGQTWLTVHGHGMDRLARPIARDDVMQMRRNIGIMSGEQDEDGWMPKGVMHRPDLDLKPAPGVAPRLGREFAPGPGDDLEQHLRDYVGGRAADGDTPADILADIQSADFFEKAGDQNAYRAALDAVAPNDGGRVRAEAMGQAFDGYANDFVQREYGGQRSALNSQKVEIDQVSTDALHRALSEHPDGVAAFKSIGDLTNQDQRALREFFHREIAREDPEAAATRHQLEAHTAAEPERETEDMFGERTENPEWSDWRQRRDELSGKLSAGSLDWNKYADTHRGHEKAYEAIQDMIRGRVSEAFARHHNTLRPDAPIKVGRSVIRNNLAHLDATDPAARAERERRENELRDSLRERVAGRYAAGGIGDKLDAARDQREAFEQAQMGFFGGDEPASGAEPDKLAPDLKAGDERHTVGHVVERQLAGLAARIGGNFRPGQPVKLFTPSMSGGDNYARQRAIKLLDANKRMGLHLGAGSGKTLVSLGAFTHMKEQGKAKRAIYAVPSIVQGQMGAEALRFLEPGKYSWHCQPGASRDERIAAYKDPKHDFCVVTHQSLRDDLIHMGAQHAGTDAQSMRDRLQTMTRPERKAWAAGVLEREGINFDFSAVDEGHNLLDRAGKDDSAMSVAIGGLTDHTPYHVSMTADPVRNSDASEVFSALQKVAPDRYTDRAEFMRRYGADTVSAKDGLKREMSRYFYAHAITPNVKATSKEVNVPLHDEQKTALSQLDRDISAMRLSRMRKTVNVDAARRVSPNAFEGAPEDKHEAIAKGLQDSIGIVRETATQRVINSHPKAGKMDALVDQIKARPGKAGVVFVHSLDSVDAISKRLQGEGLRVVTISGADSSAEKDRKRQMFHPDQGEPQADILVASDAASTGLNAQRGQFLVQYDTPATAVTHAQRRARIHRTGQKQDIDLIDLVADHPSERKARKRLADKYEMRDVMTSPLERLDDTSVGMYLKKSTSQAG